MNSKKIIVETINGKKIPLNDFFIDNNLSNKFKPTIEELIYKELFNKIAINLHKQKISISSIKNITFEG